MGLFQISLFEGVITSVMAAALIGIWSILTRFVKEQRLVNEWNREFARSMQRAEINRYFRIVVEQGKPVSPEELSHLESCYEAYHNNGGNGTGTVMYERILKHARITTELKGEMA